jgi:AraC-like DNA-binding protein
MKDKKHVEFRYYDIPQNDLVFSLTGPVWNKEYGEGREKLHFHNYYEVGHCYEGEGEMILGERKLHFYPGCISLIPTKELHTTNTFGKKAGWVWMYFDIHDVLKKLYPDDEILRDNIGHEIEREGHLLTPEMNIQKLTFFVRGIFSEMQNKEYMFRDMVAHFQIMLVTEIIRKLQNTDLPERGTVTVDIFPAVDYIKKNYAAPIRAADLARSCGMSESYFRRVFEKYMNMKPMDYVNFVRIQRACALLRETDLTIALVSDKAGYESVSTFIRNFKRVIGCTPNKWKSDEKYVKNKFMNHNITALKGWLE